MNIWARLGFCWGAVALALVNLDTAAAPTPKGQPLNIVVLLADDLGWRDLGCYGSTFYETPQLDRLAREGMKFTQAYAACPVCSPTRASLLTGRWPQRTGITDFIGAAQPEGWKRNTRFLPAPYSRRLALDEITVAEAFKKQGYATFFGGKWHLGPEGFYPENQGFDVNKGGTEQGGPYGGSKYFSPYANPRLPDGPPGEHLPDRLATEAAAFIAAHAQQPFLVWLPFYSVHTPLMARADLQAKYERKARDVRTNAASWGREDERAVRLVQNHAVYAGMVAALDEAVGKILRALDDPALRERTLVLFTSDNGGLATSEGHPTSNQPLRAGKGWLYEGGVREPFIVRWPNLVKAGSVSDAVISSPDLFPTLLEAAGLPPARSASDGVSFLPALKGQAFKRGPVFWHYPHYGNQGGWPGGAIREGDWKLIERYENNVVELYNLSSDLGEQHNLADSEPERARALRAKLAAWRTEVGAVMPSPNPNWKAP